jgi:endo-1,4-beta-xylanase
MTEQSLKRHSRLSDLSNRRPTGRSDGAESATIGLAPGGITRRAVLAGLGAGAAYAVAPDAFATEDDSLKARAARRGMEFGCAVQAQQLKSVAGLGEAIARDCAIVVPENEMKWAAMEQVRDKADYRSADAIARFAAGNRLDLRGHTAMWYRSIPDWAKPVLATPAGRDVLLKHVGDIVGHFRGRVVEWDVVNEMIEIRDGLPDGIRNFPPFAPGDIGFIADCFQAAREADPDARLVYNDFGVEYDDKYHRLRRAAANRILEELKKRNAPIDGFGIQSHLEVGANFKPEAFRTFLAEIAAFGLKISLTELDVDDGRLPADTDERDKAVAAHASEFLDVAFDERAVNKLLTWGFCDSTSWLNTLRRRKDGQMHRSLPLDDKMARKPLWHAIAESFDKAAQRT